MTHTRESLIAFTERVRMAFLAKKIRSPVHMPNGTEDDLLRIFAEIRPHDWVFSTYRGMYHALLKGIPPDEVFAQILDGRSMFLSSEPHRFLCSAIVGGMLPIAAGVAMGIKRTWPDGVALVREARAGAMYGYDVDPKEIPQMPRVWVFCGDMAARTGLFHEFRQYCAGHALPVRIVVENNNYSTDTPTDEAWGTESYSGYVDVEIKYDYQRQYPHVGVGAHVNF